MTDNSTSTDGESTENYVQRIIQRLKTAREMQLDARSEENGTPDVTYCFECDEITLNEWYIENCEYHFTVYSDGYEYDGIDPAITALEFVLKEVKGRVE